LYQAWQSNESQLVVLAGDRARIRRLAVGYQHGGQQVALPQKMAAASAALNENGRVDMDTASILERIQTALIQSISKQLKIKAQEIDAETELSDFGFDSISLTAFSNTLNHTYGLELSPTIFFEHSTIKSFAEYLTGEHAKLFAKKLAVRALATVALPKAAQVTAGSALAKATDYADASKRRHRREKISSIKQNDEQAHRLQSSG
jgi:acyl carrier protein